MMRNAILNFAKQFSYQPIVERPLKKTFTNIIVAGMGGSHLAADLLAAAVPALLIKVHKDYGLPHIPKSERLSTLVIASSYSGNTEETLDAFREAGEQHITRAAIAVGGTLEKIARAARVPYVKMPDTGIQPRSALGFSIKGLAALMELSFASKELSRLSETLKPYAFEKKGIGIAKILKGTTPIVYASAANEAIAYNWKIKLNETGKIPAFFNVLPELNHNEMTGFDCTQKNTALSKRFAVIMLSDKEDNPRIKKRMSILTRLYRSRGIQCFVIPLRGDNNWMKTFSSLVLADWVAYYTALQYGAEPEQVPMVEQFKKMMR